MVKAKTQAHLLIQIRMGTITHIICTSITILATISVIDLLEIRFFRAFFILYQKLEEILCFYDFRIVSVIVPMRTRRHFVRHQITIVIQSIQFNICFTTFMDNKLDNLLRFNIIHGI